MPQTPVQTGFNAVLLIYVCDVEYDACHVIFYCKIFYVIVIIVHISEVYVNLVPKRLIVINPVPSCMLPEIGPELSKVKN